MTREEAVKIFRKEIECMSHSKCEDCILEKVCDPMRTTPLDSEYIEAFEMAIQALEQEPKTGHWIPTYGNVKCSVCGSVKDSREVGKATHYCDFCGAKMVEQESLL